MRGLFLMGDTQLWCLLNSVGEIKYLRDNTCVYRVAEGSACRQIDKEKRRKFDLSSAEMRLYISKLLDIEGLHKEFHTGFVHSMISYLPYENDYKSVVSEHLSVSEKILFKLAATKIFGGIIKFIDNRMESQSVVGLKRKIKSIPYHFFMKTWPYICNFPSKHIRVAFLRRFLGKLGKDVYVGRGLLINRPERIFIGNHVVLNDKVRLDGRRFLRIGDNVDIATEAALWTLHHDYNDSKHSTTGGDFGRRLCVDLLQISNSSKYKNR